MSARRLRASEICQRLGKRGIQVDGTRQQIDRGAQLAPVLQERPKQIEGIQIVRRPTKDIAVEFFGEFMLAGLVRRDGGIKQDIQIVFGRHLIHSTTADMTGRLAVSAVQTKIKPGAAPAPGFIFAEKPLN
jgi:hypothetical protein